ncbi:MAG: glutathione S-transferase family protein [Gaiellaceae bacterium]
MKVYAAPYSTNCERIALAAGHKDIEVEWIEISYEDRSEVERVSGQSLVPVLVEGETVLHDSPVIMRWLDERFPQAPLWPADEARRAEVDVFVDWFNRLWKRPPNLIAAGGDEQEYGPRITASLDLFEALLAGRAYLFGDFGAADVVAFPFLKYAVLWDEGDEQEFHRILQRWLPIDGHPRVQAWIHRVREHPLA